MDLSELSLDELKKLKKNVDLAIKTYKDRQLEKARKELETRAKELGVDLADIIKLNTKRKRASAAAKYANPANAQETWSGRGRAPRWMSDLQAKGHDKAEFEIKS